MVMSASAADREARTCNRAGHVRAARMEPRGPDDRRYRPTHASRQKAQLLVLTPVGGDVVVKGHHKAHVSTAVRSVRRSGTRASRAAPRGVPASQERAPDSESPNSVTPNIVTPSPAAAGQRKAQASSHSSLPSGGFRLCFLLVSLLLSCLCEVRRGGCPSRSYQLAAGCAGSAGSAGT
jgi:hypothetical protein